MQKNEFLNLVSSPLMNLDHTYRYSGTKLEEAESLSQHIVDTIMMGIKIIDKINSISDENLSVDLYIRKAVYHDLEEVITGDIPRPLKYHDNDTLTALRHVADEVAMELFQSQFSDWEVHYKVWENAKEGPTGLILKLVDTLVVVNKVIKEVSLLNNHYMLKVAHEVAKYTATLRDHIEEDSPFNSFAVNSYLSLLLDGAIQSMNEILEEHKELMECLNIYGQSMI